MSIQTENFLLKLYYHQKLYNPRRNIEIFSKINVQITMYFELLTFVSGSDHSLHNQLKNATYINQTNKERHCMNCFLQLLFNNIHCSQFSKS